MNCSEFQDKSFEYVDGLLEPGQAEAVTAHIAVCAQCRGEAERLRRVHERLAADGGAYAECDIEGAVVDRIVREQTLKLRKAERPSRRVGLWRIVMNKKFAKVAAAAVIVIGVVFGYQMFKQTGGVSWAEVAERVARVRAVSYRMTMTMRNMPGMPEGTEVESEMVMLISDDCGMRMKSYTGGKLISAGYVQSGKQEIILLMPEEKKYTVLRLTDELLKDTRKRNGDPKELINQFLSLEYTELGRSEINGITVEGVESHDPRIVGGMSDELLARLWVDVKTGWPVRMTMEIDQESGVRIEMTTEDFVWDVAVDPAEFTAVIPEDYESMGNLKMAGFENGEQLVSGLELFAEMSGGRYPRELSVMKLSDEFGEIIKSNTTERLKAGLEPEEPDMQKILEITMMGTFAAMMVQQNRDFVYYGATVSAADAEKVLLRWRLEDDSYRVIFGDLRTEDVSAERLAELEAE
ncbi:MAG: zf-HC2 domain-containing protein [Phycisphaerae bacterium]|nr:zf-HC2 domain-containing protein [Phycisphaerae bacterium]